MANTANSLINSFSDNYSNWIKSQIKADAINDCWTEVTTPFLDASNDHIQIYVKVNKNFYTLTDGGQTIGDARFLGIQLNQVECDCLNDILHKYGAYFLGESIAVNASYQDLHQKFTMLVQCIIHANNILDYFLQQALTV